MNVGGAISLEAASGSEGQSTFTLTKGLNWRALLSDGWLSWASGDLANSGDEATGGEQILKVKAASSNPYASARTGSITVEGGGSVGSSTYNDLKKRDIRRADRFHGHLSHPTGRSKCGGSDRCVFSVYSHSLFIVENNSFGS